MSSVCDSTDQAPHILFESLTLLTGICHDTRPVLTDKLQWYALLGVLGLISGRCNHSDSVTRVTRTLGYEPLPAQPTKTLFGRDAYCYPNVIKYIKHIKSTDGFWGLYRGLFPRIMSGIVGQATSSAVHELVKDAELWKEIDGDDDDLQSFKRMYINTAKETLSRCAGVVASQPFHVIMVRCMAQYVGKETVYNTASSSIKEIWRNEGISGFFSGLIPRLLSEALTIWLAGIISHLINTYVLKEKDMHTFTNAVCSLMVTHLTYPFTLVSNCQAVCGSGLGAGSLPNMPRYTSWYDCWCKLSQQNALKRGSGLFFRYAPEGAAMTEYAFYKAGA